MKTLRSAALSLLFLAAMVGANASGALAQSPRHDVTVWFGNHVVAPGDIVDGDVNIVFGDVTCEPGGWIRGDVHNFGGSFEALDGCRFDGQETSLSPDAMTPLIPWVPTDSMSPLFEQSRRITTLVGYGIVVLFTFLLFPVRVRLALERVELHPGLSAAAGTLAAVAVIPIFLLLVLSIIGIPLVVVEIAALVAGICIGQAAVAILVGRRLFELLRPQTTPSPLGALILGLVVIGAAQILPGVGWAVATLVGLVGLGATILAFVRESAFVRSTAAASTDGGSGSSGGGPVGGAPMRSA
jgi:hypothetical protein